MIHVMTEKERDAVFQVAKKIGYATQWKDIQNPFLFLQALTQRSYSNEHRDEENNEVLAFYGDRVLEWCVTGKLMERYAMEGDDLPWLVSRFDEKEYTVVKSNLVCRANLAKVCHRLGLGEYLRTGKGSKNIERKSDDVLGELVEALIGACAVDSSYYDTDEKNHKLPSGKHQWLPDLLSIDMDRVSKVVYGMLDIDHFLDEENKTEEKEERKNLILTQKDLLNPKASLNKLYTKGLIGEPEYNIVQSKKGQDNRVLWKCSCSVEGYKTQVSTGTYTKKSEAEVEAASKVLKLIQKKHPEF